MSLRSLYSSLLPAALAAFIDFVGIGIIIPISPFYAQKFGATPLEIALLFTAYSVPQALLSPLWGRLSDRRGRKTLLLVGLLGESLSYFVLAFAPSLVFLYVSRAVSGGLSANLAIIQSYVADLTDESSRVRGLGLIGASVGLGFIFGPALGGALSVYGYRTPILLTALLALFNALLVLFLLREPPRKHVATKRSLAEVFRYARPLYISGGLVNLAFVCLQVTLALYLQALYGWGAFQVGLILAMIGVVQAAIQGGLIFRLTGLVGEWAVAAAGIAVLGASYTLLALAGPTYVALLGLVLLGVGLSLAQPPSNSLITKLTPPEDYGAALSLVQSVVAVTNILGQAAGGGLFQYVSVRAPYVFGFVLVVAGLAVFLGAYRTRRAAAPSRPSAPS